MRQLISIFVIFLGLALASCSEKSAEKSELRHYEGIHREFSISQTSNRTGQGDSLQNKIINASPDDSTLWKKLEDERNSLEPIFLIYLAEHTVADNERKAIEWYWLGLIRAQLDASLCVDQTAKSGIPIIAGLAPNVLQAMSRNQERTAQIGQKVLRRKDLRASRASPWWICSHGARSVVTPLQKELAKQMTEEEAREIGIDKNAVLNNDEENWLIPEDQMAAQYEGIIKGFSTVFSEMMSAFQDPISMSSEPLLPMSLTDNEAINEFYWINKTTLLILKGGQENEVYLRSEGTKSTTLIQRNYPLELCIAPVRVMVNSDDLEMVEYKERWQQEFTSWLIKDGVPSIENTVIRSFDNVPIYARQRLGPTRSNSRNKARHKQSVLSCSWMDENDVGQSHEQVSDWTDLSPYPGFLIKYNENSKFPTGTYYHSHTNAEPVKISDALLPLDCMRYIRHRDAILSNACVTGSSESLFVKYGWDTSDMIWLEMENGQIKTTTEKTPKHPSQNISTQLIPTKAGVVRLVRNIQTPDGPRAGGLYMETPSGNLQKIWKGWVDKAELSPDGCRIAFTANYRATRNIYTGEVNKLYIANICEYAEKKDS